MILTFACKETQKIYNGEYSKVLPQAIQRIAMRKLWMIDVANNLNDLRIPPANHLEKLTGDRKNQYSIRINSQWRICFQWEENNAYNLAIIDYH